MFPQGVSDVVSRPKGTATSEIGDHTTLAHSMRIDHSCVTTRLSLRMLQFTLVKINQVGQTIIIKHK